MTPRSAAEFRSDTFTVPTREMIEAMTKASMGDDVYVEDEDTNSFQDRVCKLAGKEAAAFMPSGTMSNQVGIRVNLFQPPYSIVADDRAHVYRNEAAGIAILSQAMVYPVNPSNGKYITLEDIKERIIDFDDIHVPPTKLICLENTISGIVVPLKEIARISDYARSHGIRMHLDGARLWNASAESGVSIEEYCRYFDTVSLCFSKGMGAPVGSVLVGDKKSIDRAIWIRKQQGGGMRQIGMLAAAANISIDKVWPTMKATHDMVKQVAKWMAEELGIKFEVPVETNFIFIDAKKSGLDISLLEKAAAERGLNVLSNRITFHHQISEEAVELLKEATKEAIEQSRKAGIKPVEEDANSGFAVSKSGGVHVYAPGPQ